MKDLIRSGLRKIPKAYRTLDFVIWAKKLKKGLDSGKTIVTYRAPGSRKFLPINVVNFWSDGIDVAYDYFGKGNIIDGSGDYFSYADIAADEDFFQIVAHRFRIING